MSKSKLDGIIETMSDLGALPNVVIGTKSTRASRGGKGNMVRVTMNIKDRRRVKYRKFTKADLLKASKQFLTKDEHPGKGKIK